MDTSLQYLVRRVVFALVAVWAVVTFVFLFVSLTPDPFLAQVLHGAAQSSGRADATEAVRQAKEAYIASRGLDRPLWVRYADWMVSVATFNWGDSWIRSIPVFDMVMGYTARSAMYVLPAVTISSIAGAFIGLYSAANRYSLPDRITSLVGYVGMGIPNFWLAAVAIILIQGEGIGQLRGFRAVTDLSLGTYVLPAAILAVVLIGNQIHYARAEVHEHLNATFVDVLRAKGVSKLRVAAHVLRNAALPLFSLFFADLLAVLMLHVFVIESIFRIPGIGRLTLLAIDTRDLPVIMGITMVIVFVGIFGNLLQDLLAFVLDPRIRTGSE
jgi:peptide/nickel transport system permease protein